MRKWSRVLLFGVILCTRQGQAQDIDRARRLFEEASNLREAGMYADAVARLREAIVIKDTPGLEYHAGFCEAKLGHYRLAIKYYERAAALLRQGASAPDVIKLLPPAHAAALEHVAKLRITVNATTAPAGLKLDQEPEQPTRESDLLVDPGKHRLVFTASGYRTETRDVTLSDAEALNIDVRFTPIVNLLGPPAARTPDSFPWKTVTVGLGFSVTAAGLGVGIASAASRSQTQDRINFYEGNVPSSSEIAKLKNDKSNATQWETIGFVSAGVGAVATISLWALWPSSRKVKVSVIPGLPRNGLTTLNVSAEF